MTQEEWDKAFRISRSFYESVGYDLHMGLRLCPAHAAKLKEMIDKAEMKDWPHNPGRKDLDHRQSEYVHNGSSA